MSHNPLLKKVEQKWVKIPLLKKVEQKWVKIPLLKKVEQNSTFKKSGAKFHF